MKERAKNEPHTFFSKSKRLWVCYVLLEDGALHGVGSSPKNAYDSFKLNLKAQENALKRQREIMLKPKLRKPYFWANDWLCSVFNPKSGYSTQSWGNTAKEAY